MILTIIETQQLRELYEKRCRQKTNSGNWERLKSLHRKMLGQLEPVKGMVNGITGYFTPRTKNKYDNKRR